MATGIQADKMNALKVQLLNYIERLNSIIDKYEDCKQTVTSNISGAGSSEIIGKMNYFGNQLPKVKKNIDTYMSTVGKVTTMYEEQDRNLAAKVTGNIAKVESLKEE